MKNIPLIKDKKLSEKFNLDNLFIKDESKNLFGTLKDRRSKFIVKKAKDEEIDKLVLITSGNAGYSLAKIAKSIKVVNIIDKSIDKGIKNILKKNSYKIIETDLSKKILKPEQIITMARENDEEVIWDVTNGYHETYEEIIKEIKNKKPDHIIVPVGSGETFVGLYNGIKKYKLKTKLIGVGVKNKWHSFADKLYTPWTPYKSKIRKILLGKHKIIRLDEKEIKETYKKFKNVIDCEPSSAVVFSALSKLKFNKKDKIILINSGKGLV